MHRIGGKQVIQCPKRLHTWGQHFVRAMASSCAPAQTQPSVMEHQQDQEKTQPQATSSTQRKLEQLHFDNLTLRALPLDPKEGGSVRQVEGACFSRVQPTPVSNPKLVIASLESLALLDIDPSEVSAFCVWECSAGRVSGFFSFPTPAPLPLPLME